jgi:hypothetical protein
MNQGPRTGHTILESPVNLNAIWRFLLELIRHFSMQEKICDNYATNIRRQTNVNFLCGQALGICVTLLQAINAFDLNM